VSALPAVDRPVWVDYGPTFIPNADVRRNVCLPQTHQSQIGQEQSYSEVTDSGRSHRRFRATPPQL